MSIDIAAGRALVAEALASMDGITPGDWKLADSWEQDDPGHWISTDADNYPVYNPDETPRVENLRFWIASHTLIPAMAEAYAAALDEVERLRARNTKLEAVAAALPKCVECRRHATVDVSMPGCDICASSLASMWHLKPQDLPHAAALRALEEP